MKEKHIKLLRELLDKYSPQEIIKTFEYLYKNKPILKDKLMSVTIPETSHLHFSVYQQYESCGIRDDMVWKEEETDDSK